MNVFQEVASVVCYLPGLNGSSDAAHQPHATFKETLTKPIYTTVYYDVTSVRQAREARGVIVANDD